MREKDIRRLPVAKNGRPVGIISLGDLAVEREPDSTLADISAASPTMSRTRLTRAIARAIPTRTMR